MPFAKIAETDGTLTVVQTKEAALRDLWVSVKYLPQSAALLLFVEFVAPHFRVSPGVSWASSAQQMSFPPVALLLLWAIAAFWCVVRSINRLCGRRTCLFDKNQGIFFYNGFNVAPLQKIREVKPQVRNGMGQDPMFRLVLELPSRRLTMIGYRWRNQTASRASRDVLVSANGRASRPRMGPRGRVDVAGSSAAYGVFALTHVA